MQGIIAAGRDRPQRKPVLRTADGDSHDQGTPARLFLCRGCQVELLICSHCDRGQIYCAESCAQKARRQSQREARRKAAGTLAALKAERAQMVARGRRIETASTWWRNFFGDNGDDERSVRSLIALMVLCCDPLAIALTAAASA
jgi:hypothetical protein